MRRDGFTLIELLVTFVIAGILASIAIPGFSTLLPNYRLRSATRAVFSDFQLAKFTAIKRNSLCTVTFNQAVGGNTYDYVVYVDADGDLEYDAGEEIITKGLLADYKGVSFDLSQGGGNGLTFADNDDNLPSIAFRPTGLPRDNAGNPGSGTAYLKNTNNRTTSVAVSTSGNISVQ